MAPSIVTIPKKASGEKELIAVPRKEYEKFVEWQGFDKTFKTFTPTATEKRALKRAREDYKKGKTISFNELKHRLGVKN